MSIRDARERARFMTSNPYEKIPSEGPCIITKDGQLRHSAGEGWAGKRYATPNEAFAALLKMQGQSVAYALGFGGYAIVQVPADRWSEAEAREIPQGAYNVFRHDHPGYVGHTKDERRMVRENCQACCLEGYRPRDEDDEWPRDEPNVSNWQRDYVQTRRPIPRKWEAKFWAFRESDNEGWKAALELDIATWGVRFA